MSLDSSGQMIIGTNTFGLGLAPVTADPKKSSTDGPRIVSSNTSSSNTSTLTSTVLLTLPTDTAQAGVNSDSTGSSGLGLVILSGSGPTSGITGTSTVTTPGASPSSSKAITGGQDRPNAPSYGYAILLVASATLYM